MKFLLPAAVVATLFGANSSLTFGPKAETTIKKSFESGAHLEMSSVEMTFTIDGEEHEVEAEGEDGSMEMGTSVTLVDTYGEMEDGRLLGLQRSFEVLQDSQTLSFVDEEGDPGEETEEGESGLQGSTVSFVWQPDEEEYKLEFVGDDEWDEDLLEGLLIEADYTFLLPDEDEEVEEGDSWELPAEVFDRISSPSGELKIWVDGERDEEDEAFSEAFRENLAGSLACEWTKTEDGLATIEIRGEITTHVDNDVEIPEGDDVPEDLELSHTIEFEFEFKGKLVWNLEQQRAHSFSIEGPVSMTNLFDQTGGDVEVHREEVYEGTFFDRSTFE